MSNIIIFFSLMGHNKKIANEIAEKEEIAVLEFAPGSVFRVFQYIHGKGRRARKASEINLSNYDEISLYLPIWGGKPAPAGQGGP